MITVTALALAAFAGSASGTPPAGMVDGTGIATVSTSYCPDEEGTGAVRVTLVQNPLDVTTGPPGWLVTVSGAGVLGCLYGEGAACTGHGGLTEGVTFTCPTLDGHGVLGPVTACAMPPAFGATSGTAPFVYESALGHVRATLLLTLWGSAVDQGNTCR